MPSPVALLGPENWGLTSPFTFTRYRDRNNLSGLDYAAYLAFMMILLAQDSSQSPLSSASALTHRRLHLYIYYTSPSSSSSPSPSVYVNSRRRANANYQSFENSTSNWLQPRWLLNASSTLQTITVITIKYMKLHIVSIFNNLYYFFFLFFLFLLY